MAEANDDKPPMMAWLHAKGRELVIGRNTGELLLCWTCSCCRPRVIASRITNGSSEKTKTWWLTDWQGDCIGFPGARWRLRDVGEAHHNDRSAGCSGVIYNNGVIDARGRLVGLPEKFVSGYSYNGYMELQLYAASRPRDEQRAGYSYNGYMELQQGCVRKDGSIWWPCPNG